MENKDINNYDELVERLRGWYYSRYHVQLDDDVLRIIIRINELEVSLNKRMDIFSVEQKKVISLAEMKNGKNYFYYALSKHIKFLCLSLFFFIIAIILIIKYL